MHSSWKQNKAPPIGLQRRQFTYGGLLVHLPESARPTVQEQATQRIRESSADLAEINAPPKSDSSHRSTPAGGSPVSEPDPAPSSKRRRLEQHVDLTTPPGNQRDLNDIPHTKFTHKQLSSSQPDNRSMNNSNSSRGPQYADDSDSKAPFAEFQAFQRRSKPKNSYQTKGIVNIHKRAPKKAEKQQVKEEPEKVESNVIHGERGYRRPDIEKLIAMVPSLEKDALNDLKQPAKVSSGLSSKLKTDRSSQEGSVKAMRPARKKSHKKTQQPPASPKQEPPPKQFIVPKGLSPSLDDRRSNRSNKSSQDTSPPDHSLLKALKDANALAETVSDTINAVQAKLKVEFHPPTSSATVSSGPTFNFDMEDGNSSSSLSSAPDIQESDTLDYYDEWRESHPASSPQAKCPLCKALVSRLYMEEFSASGVLKLREQVKFCKAHKIRSALKVWEEKNYPSAEIDWDQFANRLPQYEGALVEVLNGTRRSFYRNAFDDHIKSGTNRTLQQFMMRGNDWHGLNMGYYGTKGARKIMDYAMLKFASRIQKRAEIDPLVSASVVSASGVSGFVQAVLAPELAVMLVRDDMNVDEERARTILRESSEIGNLLHEEEDEVIKDEAEKETGNVE
ncbi:MAG: hypothetical protein Q9182_006723 [Xanthomendoza sp. 2 TL-2023]